MGLNRETRKRGQRGEGGRGFRSALFHSPEVYALFSLPPLQSPSDYPIQFSIPLPGPTSFGFRRSISWQRARALLPLEGGRGGAIRSPLPSPFFLVDRCISLLFWTRIGGARSLAVNYLSTLFPPWDYRNSVRKKFIKIIFN